MTKTTKILSLLNLLLTGFLGLVLISYLINFQESGADWGFLALIAASFVTFFASLILSIPFIIFLKKYKYENIKFYATTHLILFIFSLSLIGFSFLMRLF